LRLSFICNTLGQLMVHLVQLKIFRMEGFGRIWWNHLQLVLYVALSLDKVLFLLKESV
jgi:hypothetical protein